ncbi:MAG TPA: hemerythrin domain-containing protein [Coriobacteriia bacterium]
MKATADLRSEHGGVGRMLRIMDAMARRAGAGGRVADADLTRSLEFLRVFVDSCHHGKEEDLLFPAMRAAGLTDVEPVIQQLLAEHELGRAAVRRIAALAESTADGEGAELAEALVAYTAPLRAHIPLEERSCFDRADSGLPEAVQAELAEGYDRIEIERIGAGRHEGFHALLAELEAAYVG